MKRKRDGFSGQLSLAERRRVTSVIASTALAGIVLVAGIAGCSGPLPSRDIQSFHESTSELRVQAEVAIRELERSAWTGLKEGEPLQVGESVEGAGPLPPSDLKLQWDQDPFRPTMNRAPLHLQLRQLRQAADALNEAVENYSLLLAELAGDSENFDRMSQLAADANANLRVGRDALSTAFPEAVPTASDRGIAIISTAGAELFQRKIDEDRRGFLRDSMEEAQPALDDLAQNFEILTVILLGGVQEGYDAWFDEQSRQFQNATGRQARRAVLVAIIDRNQATLGHVDIVRTLRDAYRQLPRTHAEVREALDNRQSAVASVRRLYEDARRLKRQVEELQTSELTNGDEP